MGRITIKRDALSRIVADTANPCAAPYQRAFHALAWEQRGRPVEAIVPLLRAAASRVMLEFSEAELRDQAEAIRTGARYELRITLV
jgi:hypothetical protein